MKRTGTAYPGNKPNYYPFAEDLGKIHLTQSVYNSSLLEHTHGFVEILCITEGCGIHILDGQKFRVRRGDVFLIDYGVRHGFQALDEPFAWINCIFRPEFLGGAFPVQKNLLQLLSYFYPHQLSEQPSKSVSLIRNLCPKKENWCHILEDMLLEYDNKSPGYTVILEHYLIILLTRIARVLFSDTVGTAENTTFDVILPDIIRRLNISPPGSLSAKELADHYFISPSTFSVNFKKAMGCSFVDYVTDLRIRQACAYLLTTDATVYDIQNMVGYRDAKSFYHAFRRYTGMTPTKYKTAHLIPEKNYDDTHV